MLYRDEMLVQIVKEVFFDHCNTVAFVELIVLRNK